MTHEGGCLCGAVRYRVLGEPARASVCSCTACQRRTGSLAGFGAYFKEDEVRLLRGELKSYEHRSDESGRWLKMEFCPQCGTTVTHTSEMRPGLRSIAAGTFDDPGWLRINRHIWTRSARSWVSIPSGAESFPQAGGPLKQ